MSFDTWKSGRARLDDVSLFYREAGSGPVVVLVHGCPQHSLTWHAVGPLLAKGFRVIAVDQRGAGMSTIKADGYDGTTLARDLKGLLDSLGIEKAHLIGHDLGVRAVAAFARDYPAQTGRIVFMDMVLPGFGYEQHMVARPDWTVGSSWHLALFAVPDAAEFLVRGREREMLSWWFQLNAHSGDTGMSDAHFETYARALRKPGAMRACINNFAAVWKDAEDNTAFNSRPLQMPALVLGGEVSLGPWMEAAWSAVCADLRAISIPDAGHWLAEENPVAVADAILSFLGDN